MNNKIAIMIPDHNDPFLIQTIKSAIYNAKNPELLYFSVFSTNNKIDEKELNDIPNLNINIIKAESKAPIGVGISRLVAASSRVHKCDYHLQVDAHTIFSKNWDEILLNYYEVISKKHGDDIVISASTEEWFISDDNLITLYFPHDTVVDPYNFEMPDIKNGGRIKLFATTFPNTKNKRVQASSDGHYHWKDKDYIEQYALIGHFIFTKDKFFTEFIQDPLMIWYGDQEIMALRAWTRGWRFFAISKVPVFTQRKTEEDIKKHPRDHRHESHKIGKERVRTNERYMKILNGDILGYWGAKDMDSLRLWEEKNEVKFIGYLSEENE